MDCDAVEPGRFTGAPEFGRDVLLRQSLARGYLREAALSEALAHYARLRGERHPTWDRHLDPPVRRLMRNHLAILHK
jgi:hypothetical protein